jgi:hypothetical protein
VRLSRLSSGVHLVSRIALSTSKEVRFPEDSPSELAVAANSTSSEMSSRARGAEEKEESAADDQKTRRRKPEHERGEDRELAAHR